jgi:hypothetical protein
MTVRLAWIEPHHSAKLAWQTAEASIERARKDLVTGEPGIQRDIQYRLARRQQIRRRAVEPDTLRELLRRFTGQASKAPLDVKGRPAGSSGKRCKRDIVVALAPDLADQP